VKFPIIVLLKKKNFKKRGGGGGGGFGGDRLFCTIGPLMQPRRDRKDKREVVSIS
jgi:hypothetical protein